MKTPTRIPSCVRLDGVEFCATGKTGRNVSTGNRVDEYRNTERGRDRRVWRDATTGEVMPE